MKKTIDKIKNKIYNTRGPRYYVVYRNKENEVKTYQIGPIDLYESFGNKDDDRNNVGFKAYCFGRGEVRSFRHDRIISLTKK